MVIFSLKTMEARRQLCDNFKELKERKKKKKSTKNSISREKYLQKLKTKNKMIAERIYHQQAFTARNKKDVPQVESK